MSNSQNQPSSLRVYFLFPLITGILGAVISGVTVEYLKSKLLTAASSDTTQLIELNKQALSIVDKAVQGRSNPEFVADASRLKTIVSTMQATTMSLQRSITQAKSILPTLRDEKPSEPSVGMGQVETSTNRRGNDIADVTLNRAAPEQCRAMCSLVDNCVAWTYVRPNFQGPLPRCWLKNKVSEPSQDACCDSGVKVKSAP